MFSDNNLWRKTCAYEGSARIPFLVVPPGRLTGATRSACVCNA